MVTTSGEQEVSETEKWKNRNKEACFGVFVQEQAFVEGERNCDDNELLPPRLRKNLNASLFKSSEHPHPPWGGMSKDLGGNVGCRDKNSSWYQMASPMLVT